MRLTPTFYRENGLYNSSIRKIMPSLTKCTKIMPEGCIVLYFQTRIFLVFQDANMEGFEFKGFWHSGVSRGQNFLASRRRSQSPNRSSRKKGTLGECAGRQPTIFAIVFACRVKNGVN